MQDLKAIRFIKGEKISHDYEGTQVNTFSYRQLIDNQTPAVGIPGIQNRLLIVDIDIPSDQHKHDGREWWNNFASENGLTATYTVGTPSGGFHLYYRLPVEIDAENFFPPSGLALGVDLKYRGWVGAPPTEGYSILMGNVGTIQEIPQALLDEISIQIQNSGAVKEFDVNAEPSAAMLNLYQPYTKEQIKDLRKRLEWFQQNGTVTYHEWRDGLFSLKAGIDDEAVLDELVNMWTFNRSYQPGDELKAADIVSRADKYGSIGPGTIFNIIKESMVRDGAAIPSSPLTIQQIFDQSGVQLKVGNDGNLNIEASETNISLLLSVMYPIEELYEDVRQDLWIFKGKVQSDTDVLNLVCPAIQAANGGGLGLQKVKRAVIAGGLEVLMQRRKIDPHAKWLNEIKWDGVPRVDKFFPTYLGVHDSAYVTAVSKNFWLSLAARGIRPGCKFDTLVVLEGREGIMKSSLIEAIGGEYTFCPSSDKALQDLDDLRKMHQSVIVELPELLGLVRQDSNKVKAFLSKSHDHIRALFARRAMKHPRGFVFIGTTNDTKYLDSAMGHRRFWPIKIPDSVPMININAVKCDREQLYAEAVHRVNNSETFYEVPREELKSQVSARTVHDPLAASIATIVEETMGSNWRLDEVYQRLMLGDFIPKGLNRAMAGRIEKAMRLNLCEEYMDVSDGMRKWRRAGQETVSLSSFI